MMNTDDAWPPLPYEDWEPTKQTLHRYTQIVGKVRKALTPSRNHRWHVTLYVSTRGLTTGPMPCGDHHGRPTNSRSLHRSAAGSRARRSR